MNFAGLLKPPDADHQKDTRHKRTAYYLQAQRHYMSRTTCTAIGEQMTKTAGGALNTIALEESNHFLRAKLPSAYRRNTQLCRYKSHKNNSWHKPSAANPYANCCPLCARHNCHAFDTSNHPYGACIHPEIKALQNSYHDDVVHAIADAIEDGAHGGCALFVNTTSRKPGRESSKTVPPALLPGYDKQPDILLMQGWTKQKLRAARPQHRFPKPTANTKLLYIEVAFCNDYFILEKIADKCTKYTPRAWHPPLPYNVNLFESLRNRGYTVLGTPTPTYNNITPSQSALHPSGPDIPVGHCNRALGSYP